MDQVEGGEDRGGAAGLEEERDGILGVNRQELTRFVGHQRRLLGEKLIDAVLQRRVGLADLTFDCSLNGRLHLR